jgi:hypothetical protein
MAGILRAGAVGTALLALAACGGSGGVFGRDAPDEFAIGRSAPLVVPPDYNMRPPRPGAPRPMAESSQVQAMEALFGPGVSAPKSPAEQQLLNEAGATEAEPEVRSTTGSPDTTVVNKGALLKTIIEAPAGDTDAKTAQVSTPG